MAASLFANSFAVCFLVCFTLGASPPDNPVAPPRYQINLDLPEEQRWTELMKNYAQIGPDAYNVIYSYVHSLPPPLPNITIKVIEMVAADVDQYLPSPYAAEMRGIAKSLNIDLGLIVGMNILYDVTAFCTSIVMQDSKGVIWHARNLDYSYTDMLRNITVQVDFIQNNKTVYSGVTYAGYVGLLTGMRPKAFTITIDERDQGAWWENFLIGIIDRKAEPIGFLIRDVLANETTFESAVKRLSFTTTEASAYFIVGGVGKDEGVVITKGRIAPVDTWQLDTANGRWYEVETNYDHWGPVPKTDDRRDPANKKMVAMGQNVTVDNLFDVMSTVPVLNDDTTYTIIMSASQPDITKVWIRNCHTCPKT
ncbi:hypothetical protein FSP39_021198 [Pinctada imbricata]|uniref:N-acylethanolamine-hydrolyzing acid amidase n=1 Tax=Pinctada imbricata TaxID=66713 RepID=A0AA89BY18_PINIB|nr:hypothetical protein FSP39_021198 [Pinctada imbricata]